MNETKLTKTAITNFLATAITYFISAGFIMWGWNVLAPHINCPTFSYWEIFAMRMGLSWVMYIFWQKGDS